MTTTERGPKTASFLDPRHPRQLRRFAAARIMLRPHAAARLLDQLAEQADVHRVAVGVVIKICAQTHRER